MSFRIDYTHDCAKVRSQLTPAQRTDLDSGMAAIANDPYGCGSSATYSRDRREATLGRSIFVVYQVSSGQLLVTVVRIQAGP
ncbi:hypothetical protein [Embleya sp. NPDC050493]|uniref:hypothetical protein n=1 Tax=Embleya sp. NPDC050493 TaxID=3363989 RepID=UPI0037B165B9